MSADQSFGLATGDGGSGGQTEAQQMLDAFWPKTVEEIKRLGSNDFKSQELPLARIKKIMKLDDDVKVMMISAEAPVLFAKAAEIFITEISLRAWIHTEDNKRRTLQRNDIAMAISKYDQFDFLIDIVPREELKAPPKRATSASNQNLTLNDATTATVPADQVQYFLQQTGLPTHAAGQQIQILQTGNGLQTTPGFSLAQQLLQVQVPAGQATSEASGTASCPQQVIQIAGQATASGQTGAGLQIVHPMNGEIPISLNSQQLQMIRMQLQGQTTLSGQPILIQAPQAGHQYQLATGQSGQQFILTGGAGGQATQAVNPQEAPTDHLEESAQ